MNVPPLTEIQVGCWIDGHAGHYSTVDAIQIAVGFGFIVGPFENFGLEMYADHSGDDSYPYDGLIDLLDDALAWLNSSPTEREISGQNMPPARPEGCYWAFEDGDFGLWRYDDEGELVGPDE